MRPHYISVILLAALGVGCGLFENEEPQPVPEPRKCVGGIILEDGTCVAKCDASRCLPGNVCFENACTPTCTSHLQCAKYVESCLPVEDDSGEQVNLCQEVPFMEVGDPCPFGNECADFCLGNKGQGDPNAYCTVACSGDTDCPAGYECGWARDPREVCGTQIGTSPECGPGIAPCVPEEQVTLANGLKMGALCLQKQVCVKKDACAACETDVDCSWAPNLKCAQILDGKRCLAECSKNSDCLQDKTCSAGYCVPYADTCTHGGYCGPCRSDVDCPADMICDTFHGGERACAHPPSIGHCGGALGPCPAKANGQPGACLGPYSQAPSGYCSASIVEGTDEFGNDFQYQSCY